MIALRKWTREDTGEVRVYVNGFSDLARVWAVPVAPTEQHRWDFQLKVMPIGETPLGSAEARELMASAWEAIRERAGENPPTCFEDLLAMVEPEPKSSLTSLGRRGGMRGYRMPGG